MYQQTANRIGQLSEPLAGYNTPAPNSRRLTKLRDKRHVAMATEPGRRPVVHVGGANWLTGGKTASGGLRKHRLTYLSRRPKKVETGIRRIGISRGTS